MRIITTVALALLVLCGGITGTFFFFNTPAQAASPEKKSGSGYEVVELSPVILPIVDNNGLRQTVSMVIALEVEGVSAADEIKQMEPRLKSAYITDMYGALSKHAVQKGGVIQVNSLKRRLSRINTKILGKDAVHDVLLKVIQQRPI